MKLKFGAALFALTGLSLMGESLLAQAILAPGDPIIAIDLDPPTSNSSHPMGEPPGAAVDGTLAKYLNFAGAGSGLIVTPNIPAGSRAEAIRLTTANDGPGRDPASFEVWGTNDPVTSTNNSTGLAENWTLIATNSVTLPDTRDTVGDLIPFANVDLYKSYKVIFPTVKGSTLFQIAEVELFGDVPSFGVFDIDLFMPGDPALAIHLGPDSGFPGAEGPTNLVDGDPNTKYLNFGIENSGFIVSPASGPDVVKSFQITTANDFPERDPSVWELYGTNDPIVSLQNSQGNGESWTLVDTGSVDLPMDRNTPGPFVPVDNDTAYSSYRLVVKNVRGPGTPGTFPLDSTQYAEVQFFNIAIPEPGSLLLLGLSLISGMATVRVRV